MPHTNSHDDGLAGRIDIPREPQSKWSRRFWADLLERTSATFIGALITALTVVSATPVDWTDAQVVWTILGLPTLVSFLKGIAANYGNSETGASLLPTAPPGPEVNPDDEWH